MSTPSSPCQCGCGQPTTLRKGRRNRFVHGHAVRVIPTWRLTDHISDTKRFWLHVWPRGDCWEYRGVRNSNGYPYFRIGREQIRAHRYAYVEAKGIIPIGLTIDHLCWHKWCVKPSHLEAVTSAVNSIRGDGAKWQRIKTHCPRGHAYTAENTYVERGRRHCRECGRAWCRARVARLRAGAA